MKAISVRFQSAPRVLLRGDLIIPNSVYISVCFNPRPAFFCGATLPNRRGMLQWRSFNPRPAFFCGATGALRINTAYLKVSIRAPRSSAGRRDRIGRQRAV